MWSVLQAVSHANMLCSAVTMHPRLVSTLLSKVNTFNACMLSYLIQLILTSVMTE